MTVRVRPLVAADRDRWRRLFLGYVAFYQAQVPAEVVDLTWHRLMSGGEGFHIGLVAETESAEAQGPIGLAHVLFHRSTWSPTFYCYLEDLFVDPACRGTGAGRALIEAVYREADARGCTRTYWATQEFNSTARALYDRMATKSPFVQYRR